VSDRDEERKYLSAAHFANYQEYNKALRTWFVTFGLGAPALFLVNDKLWPKFDAYGHHTRIVVYYLIGCAVQVPSTNMKLLGDCYAKDIAAVVAEISFDELPFRLYSAVVEPQNSHIAWHDLHDDPARKIFFSGMP